MKTLTGHDGLPLHWREWGADLSLPTRGTVLIVHGLGEHIGRYEAVAGRLNDWGWHVFNHDLPFGGIGNSGMGTYHGVEGFRELSHAKPTFKRQPWFPMRLFYPPYGNLVQRLVFRYYLGTPRPAPGGAARHATS